jgi:ATP-binding cassette subfamily F protein uup
VNASGSSRAAKLKLSSGIAAQTILTAKGLRSGFGDREVLRDASLSLEARERVGLVGSNGSGKSTLAKILAGEDRADAGEVVRRSDLRVGYLAQDPPLPGTATIVEAVLEGMPEWRRALARHAEATARLERDGAPDGKALAEQSEAAADIERLGGWDKEHEAATVLGHLGLADRSAIVGTLSGGERRRVALAQILVSEPDLAILDEPTNHLDADTIDWLERWLAERFRGALLLVTHDRYLLDRVVQRTLEVEYGEVHSYEGGWGRYLEAKAERDAHAERTEANRRNYLRRELEWLRRSPQARTTKQKARIDRVTAVAEAPTSTRPDRGATIELGHVRSGHTILEAEAIAVDVAGRRLVRDFTLRLTKGERLGIVGPNGCGKTSLLRVLIKDAPPAEGKVRHGSNTRIAVLDQLRSGLKDDATIFDSVAEGRTRIDLGDQSLEVRAYLERFLFGSHEQRKQVGTLSGGERARVALARTLRDGANVVVLDEPTNDLDVTTLAALEEALLGYPGTLLVVTHDRWFLDRIATSVLAFEDGRVIQDQGGYTDHVAARRERADAARIEAEAARAAERPASPPAKAGGSAPDPKRKLTWAEARELEGLMEKVDAAETQVASLEAELADPGFYARTEDERRAHFATLETAREQATRLAERWAELEERRG